MDGAGGCAAADRGRTCEETTTMDALLATGAFAKAEGRPIVMKIDIEGHECKMLAGADNFFAKFGPSIQYLQIEICPEMKDSCKPKFDAVLEKIGLQPALLKMGFNDYFYERRDA